MEHLHNQLRPANVISSKYLFKFHIGKSVVLVDMIPPLLANSEILFVLPYARNEPLCLTHNIEN